ncbi:MAG TPA: hypothetical protein VMS71_01520, partial [Candidatus Acidoferrum sp.]|nr:hypothetical protein [Candidatus Acidoferrum sp.]
MATASPAVAGDRLLTGQISRTSDTTHNNIVHQRGLVPMTQARPVWNLPRPKAWSLPTTAIAPNVDTVIHVLVLRFNFQYETVDDSNTTGRGVMDLSTPLADSADSARYYDSVGFIVDPPPHNAAYFNAQMKALNFYWNRVSEGHDSLAWDIYPRAGDSVYQLPHEMAYYGKCEVDSVVYGLERYFVDGIHAADADPSVDFSKYNAIIMFHAGADRQNDLGFPPTCSDLFTGFINFRDSVAVKGGKYIHEAVMMPEAISQDNRATALNAVMAHEFGHQLGLVDLYNTSNFMTELGDFSLMDDNGFGTGIDFGFKGGKVFGAVPVYPDAWSRAYLGYVPVGDFRKGTDLRIVAAEAISSGMKIARVPISENSFYLLENRNDRLTTGVLHMLVDFATGVFMGPADANRNLTGEYDFLLPGSGMLIYLVDEYVAGLDYDGNGVDNFKDNQLQWDPRRRFLSLVEGSGIVYFGGDYHAGYGSADDMYRDDRNT